MTPRARSENSRYRRPSRTVPSSKTKEFDAFLPSIYVQSVSVVPSFVRAWGTTVFLSRPPCRLKTSR